MRAAALAILVFGGAAAADDGTSDLVRAIAAQPGMTVTRGSDSGTPYTEWRKAGVFYRLENRASGDVLYGADESGAGAVMCTWMIYDEVRDVLASCPVDSFPALRADLDRDVPAIEGFILANDPVPITIAELHVEAKARRARAEAQSARFPTSPGVPPPVCTAEAAGGLVGALDGMGPDGPAARRSASSSPCRAGPSSTRASEAARPAHHER